jgi:hypothetical protein
MDISQKVSDEKCQPTAFLASNVEAMLKAPLQIPQSTQLELLRRIDFLPHSGSPTSVVCSPDGTMVACAKSSMLICSWKSGYPINVSINQAQVAAFSPDSQFIALDDGHDIQLRSMKCSQVVKRFPGQSMIYEKISGLAFSPDGTMIVASYTTPSSYPTDTIRVWSVESCKVIKSLCISGYVKQIAFSPNSKLIAASSGDKVCVWSVTTDEEQNFGGESTGFAFSPDGTKIVTADNSGTLYMWSIQSKEKLKELKGHTDCVTSVAISPNGRYIVSSSRDKTVRVWCAISGQQIKNMIFTESVGGVAFHPDSSMIICSSGHSLYILRMKSELDRQLELGLNVLRENISDVFGIVNQNFLSQFSKLEEEMKQQQEERIEQTAACIDNVNQNFLSQFSKLEEEMKQQQEERIEQTAACIDNVNQNFLSQFSKLKEEMKEEMKQQQKQHMEQMSALLQEIGKLQNSLRLQEEHKKERERRCSCFVRMFLLLAFFCTIWLLWQPSFVPVLM